MAVIYLSSSYEDLKDYRATVADALRTAHHEVIGMENYISAHCRPLKACLKDIARADIYLGIFALRYGSKPLLRNPHQLSFTELEYRFAFRLNKSCHIFLLAERVPWLPEFIDPKDDSPTGIYRLRDHLQQQHLVSTFTHPEHLARLAITAVTEWRSVSTHSRRGVTMRLVRVADAIPPTPVPPSVGLEGHVLNGQVPQVLPFDIDAKLDSTIRHLHAKDKGGFLLITGEVGSGKTTCAQQALLRNCPNRLYVSPDNAIPVIEQIASTSNPSPPPSSSQKASALRQSWAALLDDIYRRHLSSAPIAAAEFLWRAIVDMRLIVIATISPEELHRISACVALPGENPALLQRAHDILTNKNIKLFDLPPPFEIATNPLRIRDLGLCPVWKRVPFSFPRDPTFPTDEWKAIHAFCECLCKPFVHLRHQLVSPGSEQMHSPRPLNLLRELLDDTILDLARYLCDIRQTNCPGDVDGVLDGLAGGTLLSNRQVATIVLDIILCARVAINCVQRVHLQRLLPQKNHSLMDDAVTLIDQLVAVLWDGLHVADEHLKTHFVSQARQPCSSVA